MRVGVPSVAILPALSLAAGVLAGLAAPWSARSWLGLAAAALGVAVAGWVRGWNRLTTGAVVAGFAACGAAGASHARDRAIDTPLRRELEAEFGGFAIDTLGPPGRHDPLPTRAVILEDAAPRDGFVGLRVAVRDVRLGDHWHPAAGTAVLSISGLAPEDRVSTWTAGRTIEAPVTFRRPARYLDDGVPDFERDVALDGTALLGSVKSALLVEVLKQGGSRAELAAGARASVRRAIARWVGARNPTSGAITTAVLIGDRASIPDTVRERLQAAGTYHVIAISGGNIAIFVALVAALCALSGLGPRASSLVTIAALTAYSAIVVSGPSVRRAVLVAVIYLVSRILDHRTRAWQAVAVAASLMLVVWPLDLRDPGFELTFGAAGALLVLSERLVLPRSWPLVVRWAVGAVAASLAVEIALLPVQAAAFSRVTLAGVILNLLAVPAMTIVQMAGMLAVALDVAHLPAGVAGAAADWAARLIVGSASEVDRVAAHLDVVPDAAVVLRAVVERRRARRVVAELEPPPGIGQLRQEHVRPHLRCEARDPLAIGIQVQAAVCGEHERCLGDRPGSRDTPGDEAFDVRAQRPQLVEIARRQLANPVRVAGFPFHRLPQPIAAAVDGAQQVERVQSDLPGVQQVLDQRQAARGGLQSEPLGRQM